MHEPTIEVDWHNNSDNFPSTLIHSFFFNFFFFEKKNEDKWYSEKLPVIFLLHSNFN